MYKLIALDVDGTLLNSKKEITGRTREALIEVQKKGAKLAIATGRPPFGVRTIADELCLKLFKGFIIGCNGALVVSAQDMETPLFEATVPCELIPDICAVIKGMDVGISSYEGNEIIVGNCLTEYIVRNAQILSMPYKYIEDFPSYVDFPVNKCLISGDPKDILKAEALLSERFAGKLSVFRSEDFLLEIVTDGVGKGEALKFLSGITGTDRSECMAFGDNHNDISMIKYAGTGIAMANAVNEAKKAADIIAPSNDADGVAKIIDNFCIN